MKKLLVIALALVIASLGLSACGGSGDDSSSGSSEVQSEASGENGTEGIAKAERAADGSYVVNLEAAEGTDLAYTDGFAKAERGKVTINFTNPQAVPHDVEIETVEGEILGKTELITEGSDSFEIDLEATGTYAYYCTVPGHREAGMAGTLTVEK